MKVTVVKEFRDLYDFTRKYEVGNEYEFEGERLSQLLALGLVTKPQAQEIATESSAQEVERTVKRRYTKRVD